MSRDTHMSSSLIVVDSSRKTFGVLSTSNIRYIMINVHTMFEINLMIKLYILASPYDN